MDKSLFGFMAAIFFVGFVPTELSVQHWLPLIGTAAGLMYFAYEVGYHHRKKKEPKGTLND